MFCQSVQFLQRPATVILLDKYKALKEIDGVQSCIADQSNGTFDKWNYFLRSHGVSTNRAHVLLSVS